MLGRRRFTYPFTVSRLFHLDANPPGMASVILQTVSGTLNAGDHLLGRMLAGAGASAHVRTQGATVVYRAPIGRATSEQIELVVEDDAILEYLPQPRVLFPDLRFAQHTNVCAGRAVNRSSLRRVCDPRSDANRSGLSTIRDGNDDQGAWMGGCLRPIRRPSIDSRSRQGGEHRTAPSAS